MSSYTYTKILRQVFDIQVELNKSEDALSYTELHELSSEMGNLKSRLSKLVIDRVEDLYNTPVKREKVKATFKGWRDYDTN